MSTNGYGRDWSMSPAPIHFSPFYGQPPPLAGHMAMQSEDYISQSPNSLQLDMAVRPGSGQ